MGIQACPFLKGQAFLRIMIPKHNRMYGIRRVQSLSERISDKQNTVGKEKGNVQIIFNGK